MKIVITGNIGCGKSTAVNTLTRLFPTYHLFDMDKAVGGLYMIPSIQGQLLARFGTYTKSTISDLVFYDPDVLLGLREIMDPPLIDAFKLQRQYNDVILDVPLFFEFEGKKLVRPDLTICVTTDLDKQITRVMKRNGFTEEKVRQIISRQMDQTEKANLCDVVIHNDMDSVEQFQQHVETVIEQLINEGMIK